jgi:hypothetical protein
MEWGKAEGARDPMFQKRHVKSCGKRSKLQGLNFSKRTAQASAFGTANHGTIGANKFHYDNGQISTGKKIE